MASRDPNDPAPRALHLPSVTRIVRRLASGAEPPWLHAEAARRMAEKLPAILAQPKTVLDASGFLGASEEVLAAAYPKSRRLVVEPHEALRLRKAARRGTAWWPLGRGRSPEAFASEAQVPAGAADLLWANMRLQGEADPPALLAQWHRALAVDGFLMFSTLGPGTLPELRQIYAEHGWGAPMAELVDMHDLGDMLVQAGFADPVMDQETLTLTWATAQSALDELRTLGGNAHPARAPGLRGRAWAQRLRAALEERASMDGRVALRFELVYGHAFRAPERVRVQPTTEVSLDAMRQTLRQSRPRSR